MPGYPAQLERDLPHELAVPERRYLVAGRLDVDQPSDDAGLRIGDLDRTVGRHEEETVHPTGVARLVLLVHGHLLVGHDGVELRVVLDPRQVAVVLDRHEGIGLEDLGRERVVARRERLRLEGRVISLEQLLYDVENRGLAGPRLPVQHEELLDTRGLPGDDGPDGPFDLPPLVLVVQRSDHLVVRGYGTLLQRISQALAHIVLPDHVGVGERQAIVQCMVAVRNIVEPLAVGAPAPGAVVAHPLDDDVAIELVGQTVEICLQLRVDEPRDVVLVRGPQTGLLVPDRVERLAPDHEILEAASHREVRIYLEHVLLDHPLPDSIEIHPKTPFQASCDTFTEKRPKKLFIYIYFFTLILR